MSLTKSDKAKSPAVKENKEPKGLKKKVLFPEKLLQANKTLKEVGLPKLDQK